MNKIRSALLCLLDVPSLISAAGGNYEYLVTKPLVLSKYSRLPKPIEIREVKTGGWFRSNKHKIAVFSKPLPAKVTRRYKLVPLSIHDPLVIPRAFQLFSREATKEYAQNRNQYVLKIPHSTRVVVWENNYSNKFPHALVTYNSAGRPLKTIELRTAEEAIRALWEYVPKSAREEYARMSLPDIASVK